MKQFTLEQRYALEAYLQAGMKKDLIAEKLGVHRSSIYREICRNKFNPEDKYDGEYADYLFQKRKKDRVHSPKFTKEVKARAREMLVGLDCSPEQITGRCRLLGLDMVSHERLYQWIWDDKRHGGNLYLHLRRQGRKHGKRGSKKKSRIPNRKDISERPKIVDSRKRWGDFEIDTVVGKGREGVILTINERSTGELWTWKLLTKEAKYVTAATVMLLKPYKGKIHTMTSDNGTEFSDHGEIEKELGIDFYFAKPYHSWERGSNENLNGLLRQYIPKGISLDRVSYHYLERVTEKLNNRPRKRLGFMTPLEAKSFKSLKQMKRILKC